MEERSEAMGQKRAELRAEARGSYPTVRIKGADGLQDRTGQGRVEVQS